MRTNPAASTSLTIVQTSPSSSPTKESTSCFGASLDSAVKPRDDGRETRDDRRICHSVASPLASPRNPQALVVVAPPSTLRRVSGAVLWGSARATRYVVVGTLSIVGRSLFYCGRRLVNRTVVRGVQACVPSARGGAGGILLSAGVSLVLGGRLAAVRTLAQGLGRVGALAVGWFVASRMSSAAGNAVVSHVSQRLLGAAPSRPAPVQKSFLQRLLGRFSPW